MLTSNSLPIILQTHWQSYSWELWWDYQAIKELTKMLWM